MRTKRDIIDILLSHVVLVDDCWVWTSSTRGKGYGRLTLPGNISASAHRKSYETFVGEIPNGLHIDHLCNNKLCINPNHLEPVTAKENNYRAFQRNGGWPCQLRKPKAGRCELCNQKYFTKRPELRKYCSTKCKVRQFRAKALY